MRLPLTLRDKCQKAMISALTFSSDLQADAIFELSSIGEFLTNFGYRLDALVEVNGMNVGIEVDGPYHFFGRVVNGKTLLKRRQVSTLDEITGVSCLIGSGMILVRTVRRSMNTCAVCCALNEK